MSELLSLLPLVLMALVLVAVLKLSAFIYKRTRLSWRHAGIYTLLVLAVSMVLGLLNFFAGSPSPLILLLLASLATHALLGGWYLGPRATTTDGTTLTFPRGAILSLINFGILVVIAIVPSILFLAVRR